MMPPRVLDHPRIGAEASPDIGHFVNENIHDIPGIHRTFTTLTFKAF